MVLLVCCFTLSVHVYLNSPPKNQHIFLDILWSCYLNNLQRSRHILLDILLICSLKQPTEKPTIEKSSAAKDPTDPPSKGEDYQDEAVSEKEDPITKGAYTWLDCFILFLLTQKSYFWGFT